MHYQWIASQAELPAISEKLKQSASHALDTEFIKVDTLYPKLGVLQINVDEQVYLVDGNLDLSILWQAIFEAKQNIFHACGEDVDLIYHYAQQKPLTNIFDTQVAMAYLGYGMQIGYQPAVESILNIQVEKDQTRSDWLARPLTQEQAQYAANDVLYLQQLADRLIDDLKDKNLYNYVLEDCQSYCQSLAQNYSPKDAYLDMANFRHSPKQLMQLKQLMTWREELALRENKPRSYILKNGTIQKILERHPKTLHQLASQYEIRSSVLREHGKHILSLINDLPDQSTWLKRLPRPCRYQLKETSVAIEQLLQNVSNELSVPMDILMRKKWMTQLQVFATQDQSNLDQLNPYLLGWRLEYVTKPILALIAQDMEAPPQSV